jgi:uncharacterized protein (TIGR03083 family)
MLQPPAPVMVLDLLPEDRAALLALLDALDEDEWTRPTACAGWSVKDVAGHILGGDLGNLSRRRDRYRGEMPLPGEALVAHVNRLNDAWMRAARQLSPRVIRDLLETVGPPLFAHFAALDLLALGEPVSWAGPDPAPTWLDVAREYTERWHHQQHIRDAVGQPGQTSRRFLHPVLATFAHALPYAFRETAAVSGTVVHLHVRGEAGGDWAVVRDATGWSLAIGEPAAAVARVDIDQVQAWRLFTKGVTLQQALAVAKVAGDQRLGHQMLEAVAIIA